MKASSRRTSGTESWAKQLGKTLNEQREQMQESFAAQQQRFEQLEARLDEQFEQLADKLAAGLAEVPEDGHDDNLERHDSRRRYKLALDDLRELKAENAELRQRLAEATDTESPAQTPTDAAISWEDSNTIIREQREKLKNAEIEISIERAKIARQHADIEEKLQLLQERSGQPDAKSDGTERTGKPVRGRWLARLGLKDMERD